jgi:AraC family transcriptional regulator
MKDQKQEIQLKTQAMNPRLLKCSYFNSCNYPPDTKLASRTCYDYEIEFYIRSEGGIVVNNRFIPFKANEINIRKPGQIVQGILPYECYTLCIEMRGDASSADEYLFGCPEKAQPLYDNPLLSMLPDKWIPARPGSIQSVFAELYQNARFQDDRMVFKTNAALYSLMTEMFDSRQNRPNRFFMINRQTLQAVKDIRDHFCEEMKVEALIEKSGFSKAYFHKCFKEYTKTTPAAMILSLRMEKAKTALAITNHAISDIAFLCGYCDAIYFSSLFRKTTGRTPTQYRKSAQGLIDYSK